MKTPEPREREEEEEASGRKAAERRGERREGREERINRDTKEMEVEEGTAIRNPKEGVKEGGVEGGRRED